ncbi:MAG: FIST C-terminal domain-containing protein [Planctomycetota bacterium]|jgi:hypothetical protein|nr:FIST C-terminal domain-containing protein [Planctomycetota bacterium]
MRAGVGFSDNPDTGTAGIEAGRAALAEAGGKGPCDLALLFSTARHDAAILREAVLSVIGNSALVVGGGAVGAMTNRRYGYGGDQVGLAVFRFEGAGCDIVSEGGLDSGEEETGRRLGSSLRRNDFGNESRSLLFYDAIRPAGGGRRVNFGTPLLRGIEAGLGFLPRLSGAALMGDYVHSPYPQWTGRGLAGQRAIILSFTGGLRLDSVVMHGCYPGTDYFTVTKAEGQAIFEINGRPAVKFVQDILGPPVPVESWPLFLLFGVGGGGRRGSIEEDDIANHMCLSVESESGAIVMLGSDMAVGDRFQIMYRSLDLNYITTRVDGAFTSLGGRKPAFAFYIDCAGRAARYAELDAEDAVFVQKAVAGRAPLLGIYSGGEISPIRGRTTAFDWTGVFCLLSVPA